jgi:hypothetical protein
MHKDFADWYRRVNIDPQTVDLQKRWEAIEAFHEKVAYADIAETARLFLGLPLNNDQFLTTYRAAFKATDDAFPMRDNNAKLQVLAGATLVNHFGESDKWASISALAVICGVSQGARKAPVPEIVTLAETTLRDLSSSLRAPQKNVGVLSPELDEKVQNLKSTLSGGGNAFASLLGPLLGVVEPLAKSMASVTNWVQRASRVEELRQEETDVLWWLFGESSRDLRIPFAEMKSPSACLIGAKELADLTRILPGPYAAESFLHKMLTLAHPKLSPVSLSDAVAACSDEWQKALIGSAGVSSLTNLGPVHLAIMKYIETGGKKTAWHASFQTASGFKATTKTPPILLSVQMYQERLLARIFSQTKESEDEL